MAICNSKLLAYQRVCYNPLGMRIQVGNRKTFGGAETIQGGMKLLGSGSRGWKPYMNLKILLSFRPCAQIFFFSVFDLSSLIASPYLYLMKPPEKHPRDATQWGGTYHWFTWVSLEAAMAPIKQELKDLPGSQVWVDGVSPGKEV